MHLWVEHSAGRTPQDSPLGSKMWHNFRNSTQRGGAGSVIVKFAGNSPDPVGPTTQRTTSLHLAPKRNIYLDCALPPVGWRSCWQWKLLFATKDLVHGVAERYRVTDADVITVAKPALSQQFVRHDSGKDVHQWLFGGCAHSTFGQNNKGNTVSCLRPFGTTTYKCILCCWSHCLQVLVLSQGLSQTLFY